MMPALSYYGAWIVTTAGGDRTRLRTTYRRR